MAADPTHRLAREIRAARAYAAMSREQIGEAVGRVGDTVGSWERGEWEDPPSAPFLKANAVTTEIPQAYLDAGFLAPESPAKRFARRARREAGQPDERPESTPEDHPEEDAGDADL